MPRITAPTLVEHRERQRAALLDAVEEIVIETGSTRVMVSDVAARAGLARSSVYEYFGSPSALLAAAVVDRMQRWSTDVAAHVNPAGAPAERIEMFIRASLELAAKGAHRLGRVVRFSEMPPECSEAVFGMYREMTAPLTLALTDARIAEPSRAADLILGVIQSATTRIDQGASRGSETDAAIAFVMRALDLD